MGLQKDAHLLSGNSLNRGEKRAKKKRAENCKDGRHPKRLQSQRRSSFTGTETSHFGLKPEDKDC